MKTEGQIELITKWNNEITFLTDGAQRGYVAGWSSDGFTNTNSVYDVSGSSATMLANRVSYTFDLNGPLGRCTSR